MPKYNVSVDKYSLSDFHMHILVNKQMHTPKVLDLIHTRKKWIFKVPKMLFPCITFAYSSPKQVQFR